LQGFLIENEEQVAALKTHCEYVMVDRARSTGAEYEAPPANAPGIARAHSAVPLRTTQAASDPDAVTHLSSEDAAAKKAATARAKPAGTAMPTARFPKSVPYRSRQAPGSAPADDEPGLFGRLFGRLKGGKAKDDRASPSPAPELPRETPQEFAARAELLPPGYRCRRTPTR
jgi:hypothetical protein